MIRTRPDDDVNGQIIGASYACGRLYYEDRPQSQMLYAQSDAGLLSQAQAWKSSKRLELGDVFNDIWPRDEWHLRIF